MLTTKPLITVSEHFTTSNKNPRHVTCTLCKHDYCYRSHPEMLRHVVGGYSGFALCGGKIAPAVYKKYEQQAESYDLWQKARELQKARQVRAATDGPLPSNKKSKQSRLFNVGESVSLAHRKLANTLYMSPGVSGRFAESEEFKDFLQHVPRNYTPPSRQTLYGSMLDDQVKAVDSQVNIVLNEDDPDVWWWLNVDVGELPDGTHVLAITISTPFAGPFLLDIIAIPKTASKNAQYLATTITAALNKNLTPKQILEKLLGFDTDNESAMTTSWDVITALPQFKHLIAMPCDGHSYNLAYGDLCSHQWAADILEKSGFLSKWARDNKPADGEIQKWAKRELGYPYRTICSGGVRQCIEHYSLGRNVMLERGFKTLLQTTSFANLRNSDNKSKAERIINSAPFWRNAGALHVFIRPTKVACKLQDLSAYTTSKTMDAMMQVEEKMLGPPENRLTAADHKINSGYFTHAKGVLKTRWEFIQSDPHHLAFAVDPEFIDVNIFGGFCNMNAVRRMAKLFLADWDAGAGALSRFAASLTDFRNRTGNFGDPQMLEDAKRLHPIAYWQVWGVNDPELQSVAIRGLSIKGDNMDVERLFSILKQVHNKGNVAMNISTAVKLTRVKFNSEALKRLKSGEKRQVPQNWMRDHLEQVTDAD